MLNRLRFHPFYRFYPFHRFYYTTFPAANASSDKKIASLSHCAETDPMPITALPK